MTVAASTPRASGAIGVRQPLIDGVEKVTGQARYTADLPAAGALVGAILRSPVAHGEIRRIDTSRARALPGVQQQAGAGEVGAGAGADEARFARITVL